MRPREHFTKIKQLPRKEWRDAILNDVPTEYQEWVRIYLRQFVERMREGK